MGRAGLLASDSWHKHPGQFSFRLHTQHAFFSLEQFRSDFMMLKYANSPETVKSTTTPHPFYPPTDTSAMSPITNPQTPSYEAADSPSDALNSDSSQSSTLSSQHNGMLLYTIANGVVSNTGLAPAIWSSAEDDLAVKLPNGTSSKDVTSATGVVAFPSPPASEYEVESTNTLAVAAKSHSEADLAKRLNLNADWMGTSQVYIAQAAYTQTSVRISRFTLRPIISSRSDG